MKPVLFIGTARADLAAFPKAAHLRAGHELFMVQVGREPADSKAIPAVGPGAREIRVRDEAGAFRVIWVTSFGNVVYVLHAFQKKTPRTSRNDLELARRRYRQARPLASAE
jgi:phage-related protein